MIGDDKFKEVLPGETAVEGEDVVPEIDELEDPVEPEIEEPQEPVGPIDPQGPLARLFKEGRMGRDLNDDEFAAFEHVMNHVQSTFMAVLPEHDLDGYVNSHVYLADENGGSSSLRSYLTWALIAGELENPDGFHYKIDGALFNDDEGKLWAAAEETFKRVMEMDRIV